MKIHKDYSGLQKLKKTLQKLSKETVEYGYYSEDVYPDGDTVAEIAAINEYGSFENPPRPFFEQSISALRNNPVHDAKRALRKEAEISLTTGVVGSNMDAVGEALVEGVVEQIVMMDDPPNSPETVSRKGKNDPLIDTGFMKESTKYKRNQ